MNQLRLYNFSFLCRRCGQLVGYSAVLARGLLRASSCWCSDCYGHRRRACVATDVVVAVVPTRRPIQGRSQQCGQHRENRRNVAPTATRAVVEVHAPTTTVIAVHPPPRGRSQQCTRNHGNPHTISPAATTTVVMAHPLPRRSSQQITHDDDDDRRNSSCATTATVVIAHPAPRRPSE